MKTTATPTTQINSTQNTDDGISSFQAILIAGARVFDGTGGQAPTPMSPVAPMPTDPVQQVQPPRRATGAAADGSQLQPAQADAMSPAAGSAPVAEPELTTEQQMDLIRTRIEARRAQLREQGQVPPPPQNKTK